MQCRKCGNEFGHFLKIGEKKHNLQNRKYCLDCSPFKLHNTKNFEKVCKKRFCKICNKEIIRKNERGLKCWICTNKQVRKEKMDKSQNLVGDSCWICGYNKCWAALEFHHIDPLTKLFGLTSRELQYSWDKIFLEMKKCVLLCACCHREYHSGLIDHNFLLNLHKEKWEKILKTSID